MLSKCNTGFVHGELNQGLPLVSGHRVCAS